MSEAEETLSTREALEAAFDEAVDEEVTEDVVEEGGDEAGVEEAPAEEPSDEEESEGEEEAVDAGTITVDEDEGGDEGIEEVDSELSAGELDAPQQTPESRPADIPDKAPASWTPQAREVWKDVPESARREIEKREREINTRLQETADERKQLYAFHQAIEPFRQTIALEAGGDPVTMTRNLLGFATIMRNGQQHEKANALSQLVNFYGVDIKQLDDALASSAQAGAPHGSPTTPQPPPAADPRVEQMWQQQQEQQQVEQQRVAGEVEQFIASHEFANDVREDMADLMDLAARRGQGLTLDQAYERAVAMRPDIQQIMAQRPAVAPDTNPQESLRRKKRASKQISGSPGSDPTNHEPETLRGALEASWDEVAGNG